MLLEKNIQTLNVKGLTDLEVLSSRDKFGNNEDIDFESKSKFSLLLHFFSEPIILLLLASCIIYLILKEYNDALFLFIATLIISTISYYQEERTKKALDELNIVNAPLIEVLRNNKYVKISRNNLVVGDIIRLEEGQTIPADLRIIQSFDLTVDESIITGESSAVYKTSNFESQSTLFKGTTINSGQAIAKVLHVGVKTELGKIGLQLGKIEETKSQLEKQISQFVRNMVIIGSVAFLLVFVLNYINEGNLIFSLLQALTLAMSILPEEIPVAFSTFMAIGSYRMMKKGILISKISIVETLGKTDVICLDKTGTITENKMKLISTFSFEKGIMLPGEKEYDREIIEFAMLASEIEPFDKMEKEIQLHFKSMETTKIRIPSSIYKEYPLGGDPPFMTHVYKNKKGDYTVAAKGAPEGLIKFANISEEEKSLWNTVLERYTTNGYRVLAVANAIWDKSDFPKSQFEFKFKILGLIAFFDPPKINSKNAISELKNAGVKVKIITGDNENTAQFIAKEIELGSNINAITAKQMSKLSDNELRETVKSVNVFARMKPIDKLRIIQALQKEKLVVAMTGDGVNDAPALKAADIGIAMGDGGTSVARKSSNIVISNSDLNLIISAVFIGRKIYANLKKAIKYIISIHIPIILLVLAPLLFNWNLTAIFSPLHVIFLELIMGPTCSIVFENEPLENAEYNANVEGDRDSLFQGTELLESIFQGLLISASLLLAYWFLMENGYSENFIRSVVFFSLIASNIFLTLFNTSSKNLFSKIRNKLIPLIIGITVVLSLAIYHVAYLRSLFELEQISYSQLFLVLLIGFLPVALMSLFIQSRKMIKVISK